MRNSKSIQMGILGSNVRSHSIRGKVLSYSRRKLLQNCQSHSGRFFLSFFKMFKDIPDVYFCKSSKSFQTKTFRKKFKVISKRRISVKSSKSLQTGIFLQKVQRHSIQGFFAKGSRSFKVGLFAKN